MKRYQGVRTGSAVDVTVDGRHLNPRLDLWNHSPTGFEWGYNGSGPAQLAIALLADCLGDDEAALRWYQDYKGEIVVCLPHRGWALTEEEIQRAVASLRANRQEHDMDVRCTTCNQPWEVYHLQHDAIFETLLSAEEAEAWLSLPRSQKLSDRYRQEFRVAYWEFGQTVINVVRCPACPKGALPNARRLQIKAALEKTLGDDDEALAAAYRVNRL
ncbi:MAG: DUF6166 domain-containing protein [Candidatus Dormibacteraceae bacterium]